MKGEWMFGLDQERQKILEEKGSKFETVFMASVKGLAAVSLLRGEKNLDPEIARVLETAITDLFLVALTLSEMTDTEKMEVIDRSGAAFRKYTVGGKS